jgi:hypothetical protein
MIFFNMSHWRLTKLPSMRYFFTNANILAALLMMAGNYFYHELKNVLL